MGLSAEERDELRELAQRRARLMNEHLAEHLARTAESERRSYGAPVPRIPDVLAGARPLTRVPTAGRALDCPARDGSDSPCNIFQGAWCISPRTRSTVGGTNRSSWGPGAGPWG
jgi:hypothetical protein